MSVMRKPMRAPLSELALLQREINQLFERLSGFERSDAAAGEWSPSLDAYECHGALVIVAEVPGLAPESLRVSCRDHVLVISGERRERRPPAGAAAFLCIERPQGRFSRKIPLDLAVDLRLAEARLEGGLLTITLPRGRHPREEGEGRMRRFPQRRPSAAAEPGFTPGEALDDARPKRGRHS